MLVTTNGMIILDDIHTISGDHYTDVLGGAGTYAILGSSIVKPGQSGWIVDRGSDFPQKVTNEINQWNSGAVFRDSKERLTTRGANYYGANDLRQFKYITPKKQITAQDWIETYGVEKLKSINSFHLICSPERVYEIFERLSEIKELRECHPTYIWEPLPDSMIKDNYNTIKELMNREEHIIISPNSEEAARLFGTEEPVDIDNCEILLKRFDTFMNKTNSCVLRCGRLGSITLSSSNEYPERQINHLPAYHTLTQKQVIDPTGGGNSFLGGFSMGYALTNNIDVGNLCGTIIAGCNIEQIGPAKYDSRTGKINNSNTFKERLKYYIETYNLSLSLEDIQNKLQI